MYSNNEKCHTYVHFFASATRCKQAAKLVRSFSSMYKAAYIKINIRMCTDFDEQTKLHNCKSDHLHT